jgi:hypothetical protein
MTQYLGKTRRKAAEKILANRDAAVVLGIKKIQILFDEL